VGLNGTDRECSGLECLSEIMLMRRWLRGFSNTEVTMNQRAVLFSWYVLFVQNFICKLLIFFSVSLYGNLQLHNLQLHNLHLHNLQLHNLQLRNLQLHNLQLHNLQLHNLQLYKSYFYSFYI
jgi:uncharacterized protein YjbI with pentapeptide repeats